MIIWIFFEDEELQLPEVTGFLQNLEKPGIQFLNFRPCKAWKKIELWTKGLEKASNFLQPNNKKRRIFTV